jgi:hypothetical protein
MYESIVVIIRGVKYILTYNTNAMCPEELSEILDFDDDLGTWADTLHVDYDSDIVEYEEKIIEEE